MSVMYNKPANLKYTDLAIYIDANSYKIKGDGEYPEEESLIYEYLYHLVYALSRKAGYFIYFKDYDYFASYAAGEIYMAMRKKLITEGTEARGKTVIPIKSSLNFLKATLFPLKINYQKANFSTVVDPRLHPNTPVLQESLSESIQQQYRPDILEAYEEVAKKIPEIITGVLYNTPFRRDKVFFRKLYLSITLTLLNDITIPAKLHKTMLKKAEKFSNARATKELIDMYVNNLQPPILWHIDDSFTNYIRILTTKVKKIISKTFSYAIHSGDLSSDLVECLMHNVYENYDFGGEI